MENELVFVSMRKIHSCAFTRRAVMLGSFIKRDEEDGEANPELRVFTHIRVCFFAYQKIIDIR